MASGAPPPLAVTGAVLDGERVGLRCEGGTIVALGPGVAPEDGDERSMRLAHPSSRR